MPQKSSAGLLIFRRQPQLEVLLVHPGGPFWAKKDLGAWSVPKGEIEQGERPIEVARREFQEELGQPPPEGSFTPLGSIRQRGGKVVHAWAVEGDLPNEFVIRSNFFSIEWPPRSGRRQEFPEVDRAEFFREELARVKINPAQIPLLDRLREIA